MNLIELAKYPCCNEKENVGNQSGWNLQDDFSMMQKN